jgi:hypothetical protein
MAAIARQYTLAMRGTYGLMKKWAYYVIYIPSM